MSVSVECRISDRTKSAPWSGIRKVMEAVGRTSGAISLAPGEPDFDTPAHVVEAAKRALDEGWTHYAPGLGYEDLREAIAGKVKRDNNIDVDPETEVIVTVGAQEGMWLSFLVTVDPGDEVIIPNPCYTNYLGQVPSVSGVAVSVSAYEENGFVMAPEDIEAAITERTRAILLNSPGNPTGAVYSRKDLEAVAEIARKHNLFVISDEAYDMLVYGDAERVSITALPGMKDRAVSAFSFSKTYAMTGWRIGYVVGCAKAIRGMQKLQENVASCVASAIQKAGVAALNGPQDCVYEMLEEFDRRRRFLVKALNEIPGLTCPEPEGAFYVFPNIRSFGKTSEELAQFLLEEEKVGVVPGTTFNTLGEGHIRISYASSMASLEEGVERIRRGLAKL